MTIQTLHRRNFLLHLREHPGYDRPVLLKEPAHDQLTVAQIAQLHNEYAVSQQLAHVPGVRPVYTIEGSESHPVLILEYIEGNSLAQLIEEGSLDLCQKLQLGVQIATTLNRIHEERMMHRDISSSNILVGRDGAQDEIGEVTIIGLGLATSTREKGLSRPVEVESVAGSMAYISPEQTGRTNRPVDYSTDLYSLGVTLYELLAGQLFMDGLTAGLEGVLDLAMKGFDVRSDQRRVDLEIDLATGPQRAVIRHAHLAAQTDREVQRHGVSP